MTIDARLKWDVLDTRFLKSQGFNYMTYYCGNYSCQRMFTKFKNYLNKYGIPFPFNEACYKHDACYALKPTITQKIKVDYIFLKDMLLLLDTKSLSNSKINEFKSRLKLRAYFFYVFVTLATPVYIYFNKIQPRFK